ncbi:TraR/DksA C4-type zinc finger protein [Alterisphingorhabdus coralli]|uniref:TraR/DksA C4-type zinc finger protein n=1 Tax=Alterisphingorhabdus coralli TaxID=3071408 RepID=UPI003872A963
MTRVLKFIICSCVCGHKGRLDAQKMQSNLDEQPTLENVGAIYPRLKCSKCGAKKTEVWDDTGALLFDPSVNIGCQECGEPIILPRLSAQNGTSLCINCARLAEDELLNPSPPPPPPGKRTCPSCGSSTTTYTTRDGEHNFIGCARFPQCRWSSDF